MRCRKLRRATAASALRREYTTSGHQPADWSTAVHACHCGISIWRMSLSHCGHDAIAFPSMPYFNWSNGQKCHKSTFGEYSSQPHINKGFSTKLYTIERASEP